MGANPRLGLLGATGRMGRIVSKVLAEDYSGQAELAHEFSRDDFSDPADLDAIVDFSLPEAVVSFMKASRDATSPPAIAIASTGWDDEGRLEIERYALRAPVIVASNYSLGVHAMQAILRLASPLLKSLGYTPVLVETHHRHKRDAPSGTAISLQEVIAPEAPSSVQTHAIRAGEVIGDHAVTFYGAADQIALSHSAGDRSIFARGAIEAAIWLASQRRQGRTGVIAIEEFIAAKLGTGHKEGALK